MRKRVILALILAAGAYLRLHNLGWGLPEVFEEATPWRQAWEMWGFEAGRLDFNPHFFHYPALSFYIQWLGQALIYLAGRASGAFSSPRDMLAAFETDPYRFFVMGRLITSLFGIASLYLIYKLARDLYSPVAGLLAALFLAFNFSHISRGQLITTDIPLVFFVLLAFIPILRIATRGNRRHYIWAGICVGLATGVKYPGLLAGTGIMAAHLFYHLTRKHAWKRIVLSSSLWASAGVALLVFFAVSPYCLLDYSGFYGDFRFEQTHMAAGHFGAPDRLVSYSEYFLAIIPGILTLPVLGLALAGIGYGVRRDRYFSLAFLAFPLVYFAVIGSWKTAADHYFLPVLPFLLMFAVLPLWKIFEKAAHTRKELLLGLAACLFLIPSILQIRDLHLHPAMPDNRTIAGGWIEENIERGAAIAKEQITPRLDGEAYFVFELPLSTVYPEETEPFYDLTLYRDFDYVITSSEVYKRYMKEPDEYPVHVRFYEDLSESGVLVKRFDDVTGSGPHLNIYRLGGREDGSSGYADEATDRISRDLYPRLMNSADPEANARLLCNLAIVLSQKRSYARALELYQLALAVDSTSTGAWHNLGATLNSLGRTREAEGAFSRAVRLDSTYARSWFGLGHLHRQAGDPASSIEAYEQGLKYDPYRLDVLRILSEQYLRIGRTDDALRVAQIGLEASRGAPEFHFAAGCIYMMIEDYDLAVEAFEPAVRSRPRDGRYAYSLAGAYYSRGDYDLAMQYARRAQELGYDASDLVGMIEAATPSRRQ
ncbi:tetratricopeptide repeat protein [Candidatus Eisenbacteria bacterium]|uniref:Tetratricopeptide repeat protein n=1 Tax=Eiseniibacteriota bacterium TaxID=2212470 RepID=A0ABV6YP09_UNCEI